MNEPRDHHYTPQFYLRNFAVDPAKKKQLYSDINDYALDQSFTFAVSNNPVWWVSTAKFKGLLPTVHQGFLWTDAYFDDEALYLNLGLIRSPSKRVSVWRVFQAKSSRSESAVYVGDARFSERPCCPQLVSSSAPQERLRKSSFVYKTMSFIDRPMGLTGPAHSPSSRHVQNPRIRV